MLTNKTALYIHIPFCLKKCRYCNFYKIQSTPFQIDQFLTAIDQELKFYSTHFPQISVQTLFLGGGTPSSLSENQLTRLFESIQAHTNYTAGIEQTIEMNPETVTENKLKILNQFGINRISLGVQSFQEQELKWLGRIHSVPKTKAALFLLHQSGFKNINMDLIYGIPNSAIQTLQDTIEQALLFNPTHLSFYGLSIEPGTWLYRHNSTPLAHDAEFKQYRWLRNALIKQRYHQYEISAFCRKEHQCLHNLNYWQFGQYIGLGPGAHSFFRSQRYAHPANLNHYLKSPFPKVSLDKTPYNPSRLLKEYFIFHLRLIKGISFKKFESFFGFDLRKKYGSTIQTLLQSKLMTCTSTHIKVTTKGLYFLNDVILAFM